MESSSVIVILAAVLATLWGLWANLAGPFTGINAIRDEILSTREADAGRLRQLKMKLTYDWEPLNQGAIGLMLMLTLLMWALPLIFHLACGTPDGGICNPCGLLVFGVRGPVHWLAALLLLTLCTMVGGFTASHCLGILRYSRLERRALRGHIEELAERLMEQQRAAQ
jgi:hypothetical protein